MALIICPECGKEISDSLKKCVKCGYKMKKNKITKRKIIVILFFAIVCSILVTLLVYKKNNLKYPTLMKVIQQEYTRDIMNILGDDYEKRVSDKYIFYTYKDIAMDGVFYNDIIIAENERGISSIDIRIIIDSDNLFKTYYNDMNKVYGKYFKTIGKYSYEWKTERLMNPRIHYSNRILNITVK